MAFAKAVTNADENETIDFLLEIITNYSTPKSSNRGILFKNKKKSREGL